MLVYRSQRVELNLARSLQQELQEYYGIKLSLEHMPEPYDCTFKVTLWPSKKSAQKLNAYIEQQLKG